MEHLYLATNSLVEKMPASSRNWEMYLPVGRLIMYLIFLERLMEWRRSY